MAVLENIRKNIAILSRSASLNGLSKYLIHCADPSHYQEISVAARNRTEFLSAKSEIQLNPMIFNLKEKKEKPRIRLSEASRSRSVNRTNKQLHT